MPDQPTRLQKQQLDTLVERQDCTGLAEGELYRLVGAEPQIRRNVPEQGLRVDPRDGMPIVYSMARAQRPHDTSSAERPDKPNHPCPICEGRTSHIIDVAPAGPGVTFINKNLFPVVYPRPLEEDRAISGVHLVQWTSNEHHLDLHNIGDRHMEIVLERLAALEGNLLHRSTEHPLVESLSACETPHHGYVGIIKNYGQQVGGSLSHGHQQIMHSNVRALRVAQDQRFLAREGHSMASHLLGTNPPELTIADYGSARLLTPYFMRRPLQAIVVNQDTQKSYLHELTAAELGSLGRALRSATAAVIELMERLGRQPAYNLVIHNGPIGGLYIEVLPWTQEYGGYEQQGLFVCVGTPEYSNSLYRDWLDTQ